MANLTTKISETVPVTPGLRNAFARAGSRLEASQLQVDDMTWPADPKNPESVRAAIKEMRSDRKNALNVEGHPLRQVASEHLQKLYKLLQN